MGVAVGSMVAADDAHAQKKNQVVIPARPIDPPMVKSAAGIELRPAGLRWGMSPAQLAELYDREIDRRYVPLYEKAQPGPQTSRLDASVASAKQAFRRSKIDFGDLPTGIDSTALKGEYSYKNGESMMQMTRSSGNQYFFFINDRLWKVYDEVPLGRSDRSGHPMKTLPSCSQHVTEWLVA